MSYTILKADDYVTVARHYCDTDGVRWPTITVATNNHGRTYLVVGHLMAGDGTGDIIAEHADFDAADNHAWFLTTA